jgi:hypothetical protein
LYKDIAKEIGGKYSNHLITPIKIFLSIPLEVDSLYGAMEQPFFVFLAKAPIMKEIRLWGS